MADFYKKTSQYSSSIGPQVQLCRPQASIMHSNNLFRPCFTLHTRGHDIEGKISYIVLDTKKILSCTIVMWRHCLPFMQCPLVVNTFTTLEPSLRVYGSKVLNDWENVSFSIQMVSTNAVLGQYQGSSFILDKRGQFTPLKPSLRFHDHRLLNDRKNVSFVRYMVSSYLVLLQQMVSTQSYCSRWLVPSPNVEDG